MAAIESLVATIQSTDWDHLLRSGGEGGQKLPLQEQSEELLARVRGIHDLISDGFLNHQIHMRHETQPLFPIS